MATENERILEKFIADCAEEDPNFLCHGRGCIAAPFFARMRT